MTSVQLRLVTCASDLAVLGQRLLASPCLQNGGLPLSVYFNARHAAEAFNAAMQIHASSATRDSWLVWLHQDVYLPTGWDTQFMQALESAQQQFPKLAVAGVYGLSGAGPIAQRAGHVLDRGHLLREQLGLPCLVDSLDELLFAVRVDSKLALDPELGFDFYATDLVLQAQAQGLQCVAVDACCEHWSSTPSSGAVPPGVVQRIKKSAAVFEAKWAQRLPISTPCFDIQQAGDVARFIDSIVSPPK